MQVTCGRNSSSHTGPFPVETGDIRLPQNSCVSVMVLSSLFYASVEMINSFLVTMVNYIVVFLNSWDKLYSWSRSYLIMLYCPFGLRWIGCAKISKIFVFVFTMDITLEFSCDVWFGCQGDTGFIG